MPRSVNPELKDRIESLTADGKRTLSAGELADVIGEVARTLTADLGPLSAASAPETDAVPTAPDTADNAEALDVLSQIGTVDEGEGPLASISRDLEEIRNATQDAAAKFLACAENIEEMSERPDVDPDDQVVLMQASTDIFEASAFQDLTGQRLSRIADTLRQIEYYIASTKAALGDAAAAEIANTLSDTVEQTESRKVEYILHGPQDAGTANSQEEIDKILASFD
jgi:chemotaxis protein CheZ